ncbi:MAG: hypothetical protein ACK5QH_06010 [Rubrivivax sp.]|jgi:hypothetical protein
MSFLGGILGGGNILGALFNVASMVFPALQMANSLFNALGQAVGTAIKEALTQLTQEAGLPKFLAEAVKGLVDSLIGGKQQASNPAVDAAVKEQLGDGMQTLIQNMVRDAVKEAKDSFEEGGGKASGTGGWLVALAKAFGKIADKAAKVLEEQGKNLTSEKPSEMIEYQAKSQEFSQMMNTFTNAIKTIGEAQASTVRKG